MVQEVIFFMLSNFQTITDFPSTIACAARQLDSEGLA
jgi:hypothetical protein